LAVAQDLIEVETQQGEHGLGDRTHLLVEVVLVVERGMGPSAGWGPAS